MLHDHDARCRSCITTLCQAPVHYTASSLWKARRPRLSTVGLWLPNESDRLQHSSCANRQSASTLREEPPGVTGACRRRPMTAMSVTHQPLLAIVRVTAGLEGAGHGVGTDSGHVRAAGCWQRHRLQQEQARSPGGTRLALSIPSAVLGPTLVPLTRPPSRRAVGGGH